MSALASAYFVNGDTGLKQTSEVNFATRGCRHRAVGTPHFLPRLRPPTQKGGG